MGVVQIHPKRIRTMTNQNILNKLLKEPTDSTLIQLFRYTFVGGTAFLIDFGSLFVLTEYFHVYYLVSAAVAFTLGLIVNYILSIVWVFNTRSVGNKWMEFGLFTFIGIVGIGLNEAFIWFFTEHIHFHYLISKIISTFFVYFWNFTARKFTLFK